MNLFDTPLHIAGFILSLISASLSILMHIFVARKKILATKLTKDVVGIAQYACMFSWTGMALNIIAIFREIIFFCRTKYKFAKSIIWLFVFLILCGVIAPIFSWHGWVSILPSIGSCFLVLGLYSLKAHHIKLFYLAGTILWGIYDLFCKNYVQAIYIGVEATILIISLTVLLIKYLKEKKTQNNPVKPEEEKK